ncbi:MAG: hypothetical protein ACTSWX_06400 [Promethearchaeota archaeon]
MNTIKKGEKSLWIAFILNFFLWGSGYIYLKKRQFLGIGLLVAEILMHISWIYLGFNAIFGIPGIYNSIGMIILSLVLAYDAYKNNS